MGYVLGYWLINSGSIPALAIVELALANTRLSKYQLEKAMKRLRETYYDFCWRSSRYLQDNAPVWLEPFVMWWCCHGPFKIFRKPSKQCIEWAAREAERLGLEKEADRCLST